jgi:hypothetical protein
VANTSVNWRFTKFSASSTKVLKRCLCPITLRSWASGTSRWKAFHVIVEENRAKVNFELVERLAEREEKDWAYFGRLRHEPEKKLRDGGSRLRKLGAEHEEAFSKVLPFLCLFDRLPAP